MHRWILVVIALTVGFSTAVSTTRAAPPAQAIPDAASTQAGTPAAVAPPPVEAYAEIGPAYDAAREAGRMRGQELVDLLLRDPAAFHAELGPEVSQMVPIEQVTGLISAMEANRVHFELPQFGAVFDGHLHGQTIEGFFTQGMVAGFQLQRAGDAATPTAAAATPAADPLVGAWSGVITAPGLQLEITVAFASAGDALTGTIDIPEQRIDGMALSAVSYQASRPLGERRAESVLPQSPALTYYAASYAWGDAALMITLGLDADGVVSLFSVAPDWPLSPAPAVAPSTTSFALPFEGLWWVFWGGETVMENYHAATPAQRYAYDLTIWNEGGAYRGDGTRNEEYWVWRQPVLAPAAGTVVATLDGLPDNTPLVTNPNAHPAGNHVVLQTGPDEYVFLAHLGPGTLQVAEGDTVDTGDVIGLVGNSGNSTAPHLHIHAQNRPDLLDPAALGLPMPFTDYQADGQRVASGVPTQGQLIGRP